MQENNSLRQITAFLRLSRRLLRGTVRAVQVGHLFPENSRRPPTLAPGGTREVVLELGDWRELQRFTLSLHRLPLAGLSRPVRILQLSDAHVRGEGPWLDALTAHLRRLTPDLLLLTGDMVTKEWSEAGARALLAALPQAPLGRFAVMGNWEHWAGADPERWGALLAEYGVELLRNRGLSLGPIGLGGTDDLLAGAPEIEPTLAGMPIDRPGVVMSHSPAIFPSLARDPVRLVLSGHAHGGQIRVRGAGSFFVPQGSGPYVSGWFQEGDTYLFVSRGVGWSLAPMRWRCPPELAEILLLPA